MLASKIESYNLSRNTCTTYKPYEQVVIAELIAGRRSLPTYFEVRRGSLGSTVEREAQEDRRGNIASARGSAVRVSGSIGRGGKTMRHPQGIEALRRCCLSDHRDFSFSHPSIPTRGEAA